MGTNSKDTVMSTAMGQGRRSSQALVRLNADSSELGDLGQVFIWLKTTYICHIIIPVMMHTGMVQHLVQAVPEGLQSFTGAGQGTVRSYAHTPGSWQDLFLLALVGLRVSIPVV